MTTLAHHSLGRVLLHLAVLARTRRNVRWHLAGIRRELSLGSSACRQFITPRAGAFASLSGRTRTRRVCRTTPRPARIHSNLPTPPASLSAN